MTSTRHAAPVARQDRRIERASWVPTLGPGMVLGAIGTVGLVVAMFMSWQTNGVHPSGIPFAFLFDYKTTAQDPSILLALIPMAVLLAVGTAMPRASARRASSARSARSPCSCCSPSSSAGRSTSSRARTWVTCSTPASTSRRSPALVGLVSGFMPSGWAERRWTETESTVEDRRGVNFDEPRV